MKNTKPEEEPIVIVPEENRETDCGIEVTPEYETGLFIARVPEVASATPRPELGDGFGRTDGQQVATVAGTLRRWTPILVKFASVQMLVPAIGFGSRILVIRSLPKREYALCMLCNTTLAAILVLADSRISSALTAIGGRVWQDRRRLSQLIQTALRMRRWMAAITLPLVISVLACLLLRNGASAGKTAALVAIVLAGCGLDGDSGCVVGGGIGADADSGSDTDSQDAGSGDGLRLRMSALARGWRSLVPKWNHCG